MRTELLRYAVDPPVAEPVAADATVAQLATLAMAAGGRVHSVLVSEAGDELAVVADVDDAAAPLTVELPPRFTLRGRLVRQHVKRPGVAGLATPDPWVPDPRPVTWQAVEVRPDGRARISYGRGANQRLHSVEVRVDGADVVVTVWVGTVPTPPGVAVPAVLIVEQVEVEWPASIRVGP